MKKKDVVVDDQVRLNLKVGNKVSVIDDELGKVTGVITSFNHEGYPIVQFQDAKVIIFLDQII